MSTQPVRDPPSAPPRVHQVAARLRLAPTPPPLSSAEGRPHRGAVDRPRLVGPLVEEVQPLAVLVAPAGFGKTTLLGQWRTRDSRPFAWVTLSAAHDDPGGLLSSIALTLRDLQPAATRLAALPATAAEVAGMLAALPPSVLVLDDLHLLRSAAAQDAVAELAAHVPPGGTLALASRRDPPLPLGRARAQDEVAELRAGQLAMTPPEACELLRRAGLELTAPQFGRLVELTSGWAAALQLAARAARERADPGAALDAFGGDDGTVGEYVREEILSALGPDERVFLRRTSLVARLGGPVCNAVLECRGSAATLRRLTHDSVPLVALDRAEHEYRHHPLLAQALRAELRRTEPELEPELHRRLSRWHEEQGDVAAAAEHALAARDAARLAELLAAHGAQLAADERLRLVEGWLGRLGDRAVAARPALALGAAVTRLARGESDAAERWAALAVAGPDKVPPGVEAGAALVRAFAGRHGVEQMGRDAAHAYAAAPEDSAWGSLACLVEGSSLLLAGRAGEARARLEQGGRRAILDAPLVRSLCLAELALIAIEGGDADDAAALAARARAAITGEDPMAALTYAASALADAQLGRLDAARADLQQALCRLGALPDLAPWFGALARVALARVQLKLSDAPACRRLLSEASRLRRQADGAVGLQAWIDETWGLADEFAAGPVACPSTLTMAELRVLRMLPSHLTFREIAERLHVSSNTVKTQAHAVYRKLDASSRSEAVAHASAIGLVDPGCSS